MAKKPKVSLDSPDYKVALSMSLVIFGFDGQEIQVLTYRRDQEPLMGTLSIPTRFVQAQEDLDDSARKLFNDLFIKQSEVSIEQLRAFGAVERFPQGRVLNVAYYALVKKIDFDQEKWGKYDLAWFPKHKVPDLVFDHNEIVEYAKERLKRRVKRRPVGFHLMPEEFTLSQLQNLYEQALDKTFDKRNFRKKLAKTSLIKDIEKDADGSLNGQKKGSKLYRFNSAEYKKMKMRGYDFSF